MGASYCYRPGRHRAWHRRRLRRWQGDGSDRPQSRGHRSDPGADADRPWLRRSHRDLCAGHRLHPGWQGLAPYTRLETENTEPMEAVAGTLGLNVAGLIWQSINFIVLLVLLRMVLFKPVRGMLDDRRRRVQASMEQA